MLQFPEVTVIEASANLWWTGAINQCISDALNYVEPDDLLLTLNNDNELPVDYLKNLIDCHFKYPKAIITSVIYDIKKGNLVSAGYRQNWLLATAYPIDFKADCLPTDHTVAEVTHASGRGSLFPVQVFQHLGLFDEKHLPHYFSDYDFTIKATRANYKIYSCLNCKVYSYVDETGLVKVLNKFSIKTFYNYFASIRSPGNLSARWWFGWNNCPRWYLPVYMLIDLIRVGGGYFKNLLK